MTDPTTDIPEDGPGFHMFAKLGVAIESLSANLAKQQDLEQRRLSALPINIPFQFLSNIAAGTTDVKDFGGPQPGRVWVVRLLTAFASPVAANAAVVSWYVGQVMPGDAAGQLPLSFKRWEFSSLPGEAVFGSNTITIRAGEHLIAGITNIPASSRIFLNGVVNDEPLWASRVVVANDN